MRLVDSLRIDERVGLKCIISDKHRHDRSNEISADTSFLFAS